MITAEVIYSPQRRPSVSSCTNGPQIGRDMCSTNQQLRRNDFWEDGGGLFLYTRSLGGAEKKPNVEIIKSQKVPRCESQGTGYFLLNFLHFYLTLDDLELTFTGTTRCLCSNIIRVAEVGESYRCYFANNIIFKDMYWTICHINQSVRLPILCICIVINWFFTAVYHRYTYVNKIGYWYSIANNTTTLDFINCYSI